MDKNCLKNITYSFWYGNIYPWVPIDPGIVNFKVCDAMKAPGWVLDQRVYAVSHEHLCIKVGVSRVNSQFMNSFTDEFFGLPSSCTIFSRISGLKIDCQLVPSASSHINLSSALKTNHFPDTGQLVAPVVPSSEWKMHLICLSIDQTFQQGTLKEVFHRVTSNYKRRDRTGRKSTWNGRESWGWNKMAPCQRRKKNQLFFFSLSLFSSRGSYLMSSNDGLMSSAWTLRLILKSSLRKIPVQNCKELILLIVWNLSTCRPVWC